MKLVISRNEPWALSVAAATATTTAAVLLLLLLPQTSRTSAIGMQEEQQQLPPSALPAARYGGEETTRQLYEYDLGQQSETTCATITIEGSDGTHSDGKYLNSNWTFSDRPVFVSDQSISREFILAFASGLESSSTYDDDYVSSTLFSPESYHTGSYSHHAPHYYNSSANSYHDYYDYDDDWWNSHEDDDEEEEDGDGEYPRRRRGLAGESGPNAEIGGRKPSHRGDLPWHETNKEGIQRSVVSALSLARKSRRVTVDDTTSDTFPLPECMWFLLPFSFDEDTSPYPVHFSLDCAEHPADITSFWFLIEEDSDVDLEAGLAELEELEHMDLSEFPFPHVDLSITCTADVIDHDEDDAGYTGECVDLGASGCTSREECCSANYLTVEEWCRKGVCGYETASLSCWDGRCCNKTGRICEKDKHCCDGLSCMDGFCGKPTKGCLALGLSGCASSTDCCSDYFADTFATCRKGRCCYKAGGGCQKDTECCKGYTCDDDTSKCKRTY